MRYIKIVLGASLFLLVVGFLSSSGQKSLKEGYEAGKKTGEEIGSTPSPNPTPTQDPTPESTPTPTLSSEPTPTVNETVAPTPTPEQATPKPTPTTQPSSSGACKYSCTSPDRDCSDFSTQAEAQAFFNCCGFTATNDPMKLDGVGVDDGVACESLP